VAESTLVPEWSAGVDFATGSSAPTGILDAVGPNWEQGNGGLGFRCQLNTPTSDRLRQLESLCTADHSARLKRILIDHQDLIRLREGGYAKNRFHTARCGWWVSAVVEEEAVKCNRCGQTCSVREFGNGCPGCKPRGVGKKDKGKRPTGMGTEVQGADTAGEPDPATASTLLAPGEPMEPMIMEPSLSDPEPPLQRPRTSTRDKEATKCHNVELKHSCRSTKVSKVKVPLVQVSIGLKCSFCMLPLTLRPCLPPPCPGSSKFAGSTILFNRSLMIYLRSWYTLLSNTTGRWSEVLLVLPPVWS